MVKIIVINTWYFFSWGGGGEGGEGVQFLLLFSLVARILT